MKFLRWLHWFIFWKEPRPIQMSLPFFCVAHGLTCGPYVHDAHTGFYGHCKHCGVTYEPICDR